MRGIYFRPLSWREPQSSERPLELARSSFNGSEQGHNKHGLGLTIDARSLMAPESFSSVHLICSLSPLMESKIFW
jgi:hypothetical protein